MLKYILNLGDMREVKVFTSKELAEAAYREASPAASLYRVVVDHLEAFDTYTGDFYEVENMDLPVKVLRAAWPKRG